MNFSDLFSDELDFIRLRVRKDRKVNGRSDVSDDCNEGLNGKDVEVSEHSIKKNGI